MAISPGTQAAADLLRGEQLIAMAEPQPRVPPIDYNIPYSPGLQGAPYSPAPRVPFPASGIASISDPDLPPISGPSQAVDNYPETDPVPLLGGQLPLLSPGPASSGPGWRTPEEWVGRPSSPGGIGFQEGTRGRTVGDSTRQVADLVRAEQLAALGVGQPTAASIDYNASYSPAPRASYSPAPRAPVSSSVPPVDYNIPYSPGLQQVSAVDYNVPYSQGLLDPPQVPESRYYPSAPGFETPPHLAQYREGYYEEDEGLRDEYMWVDPSGYDTEARRESYYNFVGPPGSGVGSTQYKRISSRPWGSSEEVPWSVFPTKGARYNALPEDALIGPSGLSSEDVWAPYDLAESGGTQFQEGSEGRTVGGHRGLADLADRGRYGDSMLVHMAPEEVAGLASLTENGVTINPETGLPEMFNLKSILPTIIGIGANFIPGVGPIASAAISGLATAAFSEGTASERIGKGLLAGIGSWGMGKLGSMIGGAGAQAGQPGVAGFGKELMGAGGPPPELAAEVFDPSGAIIPYANLKPPVQEFLGTGGVNSANYLKFMQDVKPQFGAALGEPKIDWNVTQFGPSNALTRTPQFTTEQMQSALAGKLDPLLKPVQAAAAYKDASPFDRLGYMKQGLGLGGEGSGMIDMAWKPTAPGRLGLGDLVTPSMAALAGVPAMFPEEKYEYPSTTSTYVDRGPYFPEDVGSQRRQRELPPGYIPGVSPQFNYFARGGTRGKTVSGGLPTIYAFNGGHPAMSADNAPSPDIAIGSSGYPSIDSTVASVVDVDPAVTPSSGPVPVSDYNTTVPGQFSLADLPTPEAHQAELDVAAKQQADTDKGLFQRAFDFTVPQGRVDPETGGISIVDSINPGAVLGTAASLFTGIPGLGMVGSSLGRDSMGLWGSGDTSVPDVEPGGPGGANLASRIPLEDTEKEEGEGESISAYEPITPYTRTLTMPPASYRPGVDPQHSYYDYYAQEGTGGMTIEENIDVEAATEVPPGVAATTGIMQGAPVEVQDDVEVRLRERQVEEPQNPRERAIYDRAVLALQNALEPEVAQRAIDEFLEVFGPDALHMLQEMVRGDRENGGTVETVSGETTVEEGEIQGPDVIAGKIVDPVTGEETANLRVGENEYIEPAASLVRRAQVAGLPPTPENGAMIRGEEERMLRRAVG